MEGGPQPPGAKGSLVQEVMEEEWSALQSEDRSLPSLWGATGPGQVGSSYPQC